MRDSRIPCVLSVSSYGSEPHTVFIVALGFLPFITKTISLSTSRFPEAQEGGGDNEAAEPVLSGTVRT